MDFTFTEALRQLGPDAAFRLMNDARPPQAYLGAQFLPERPSTSWDVKSGSMTVRTIMAGLVGMDSPYPEGSAIDISTFLEQSAKLAHAVDLPERALRTLQDMLMRLQLAGGNTLQAMVEEVLNFTNALVIQPHLDAAEWMRWQALATGGIDWTFNQKNLKVDYAVPTANKLTARTGNDGYGGSASKFWTDIRQARKVLRYNVRAFVAHPDTLDMIIYNSVNSLQVVNQANNSMTVQRLVASSNGGDRPSTDARDTVTLIAYGLEGEILDTANQGKTKIVPFMPTGKIVAFGNNTGTQYTVGAGSRMPNDYELGYTHLAPTVEGSGRTGRWARVFTPENRPWALRGEGVQNALPVIEAPEKLVILTTDMV
jgi:hypothetical protein